MEYTKEFYKSFSERNWQIRVQQIALQAGWHYYHAPDNKPDKYGRVQNIVAGFPDLILVHDDGRIIFAELKKEGGRLSEWQKIWIERLKKTGNPVYVWYPHNLEEIEQILGDNNV
jgi:hypothetical protein